MKTVEQQQQQLVLEGNAYHNFVDTIKSKRTLEEYRHGIMRFMRFLKVTDVNNLTLLDAKEVQQKIIEYIGYLKQERQIAAVTINLYVASVIHFYAMNDVTLNRKRIGRFIPEKIRINKDRAYTREEISKILEFCDMRNRAIVLLFASTGIRVGAIPDLRIEHLQKIYDQASSAKLYQITAYDGFKEEYITFCTPECRSAIDNYIKFREGCGEVITPKSPLFREQFDVTDLEQIRKHAKKITVKVIVKKISKILHLSGISPSEHLTEGQHSSKVRKQVMRTHGFRKFVNTAMVNAKLDFTIRQMLLGHGIGLDENYLRLQPHDLLQEYLKAVDALTINEEHRLRRKVEQLTVRADKLELLHNEIQELKNKLGL
jgi:integrase